MKIIIVSLFVICTVVLDVECMAFKSRVKRQWSWGFPDDFDNGQPIQPPGQPPFQPPGQPPFQPPEQPPFQPPGQQQFPIRRPPPTRPTSPTTPPTATNAAGSTTTTASPAYRNCIVNCRTTPQYNPVCGSNRVTYDNQAKLNCARQCGLEVEMLFLGACG